MIKQLFKILILAGLSSAAIAQDALDVETTVHKEQVVVNEDGERTTELVPAETVIPGETVVYTITFRNTGDDPADNIVITNPIAAELTYLEGSAFAPGMQLQFSIDGGTTFAAAEELSVEENGETRAATAADYTHVRWVMDTDLASGAQGLARFSAVLK